MTLTSIFRENDSFASTFHWEIAARKTGAGFASDRDSDTLAENDMPNRGELAIPVKYATHRATSAVKSRRSGPDGDAWTIIAFCAIGWLMTLYFALSTVGADVLPKLMTQVPFG